MNAKLFIQAITKFMMGLTVLVAGVTLSGFSFDAPYEIGDALSKAGFDVVCHATNHALDSSFTKKQCAELCDKVWGGGWR